MLQFANYYPTSPDTVWQFANYHPSFTGHVLQFANYHPIEIALVLL